ncbi:uncharacterized protein [Erythrolamprus reginae]|uniref:uncharacterized protein n=1 Tax=Erythrolamprus reginae TaxID=121349 RepID=UPI00396C75FA
MDAFGLVPMLTLLHVMLQVSSSAEPLTRPTLFVQPEYQEYYEGENIRLNCSTFQNFTVEGYQFFQGDGKQIVQKVPNVYRGSGTMDFQAQRNNTGNYSCAYWLKESGREVRSDQSHISSIHVNAAPSAPSLNYSFFESGNSIRMECTAPPEANEIRQFHFIANKMAFLVMATINSYTYNLTNVTGLELETIKCAYVQYLHGRHVLSSSSKTISIDMLGVRWVRLLAVGGSFFTINGLIFLISYCISLRNRSLLQKTERTT